MSTEQHIALPNLSTSYCQNPTWFHIIVLPTQQRKLMPRQASCFLISHLSLLRTKFLSDDWMVEKKFMEPNVPDSLSKLW